MCRTEIADDVSQFIRKNFIYDNTRVLSQDESLLGGGILDSTGILELISFLEETYGLRFKDQDLVADNFDSVARIEKFVSAQRTHIQG